MIELPRAALTAGEIAGSPRESDTYALLLFSTTGVMVLAGTTDLLVLIVGFLLISIPLYGIVGLTGGRSGAEAALKTYLMGALSGILLMLGVTVLYALAGGTDYALLRDALPDAPATAVGAGVLGVDLGPVEGRQPRLGPRDVLHQDEALRLEPSARHPLPQPGQVQRPLLGVVGEGASVHREPGLLIQTGAERVDPDAGGQRRRRKVGEGPRHDQQRPDGYGASGTGEPGRRRAGDPGIGSCASR